MYVFYLHYFTIILSLDKPQVASKPAPKPKPKPSGSLSGSGGRPASGDWRGPGSVSDDYQNLPANAAQVASAGSYPADEVGVM